MSTTDVLAQQRDAKFKVWLQNKALRDKALEYLQLLNPSRAENEEQLKEVGIALCSVDRLLESAARNAALANEDVSQEEPADKNTASKIPPKSLKSIWFKWATEHHTFNLVKLQASDISNLGGAVKEQLDGDTLPSLKYFLLVPPKPNEKPKSLTNDQRILNQIFMGECKKLWREAKEELDNRLVEYVARKIKQRQQQSMESERKGKAEGEESSSTLTGGDGSISLVGRSKLEIMALNDLSIRQLRLWVEEDEDTNANKTSEEAEEKLKLSKVSHEQWVKHKDSLRIRIPENMPPPAVVVMSHGGAMAAVRPIPTAASLSDNGLAAVQLMSSCGLKYMHATEKGRQGRDGQLEKMKKQLLTIGFVSKENFDEEHKDDYRRELMNNKVVQEKELLQAKAKEDNAKAFDDWVILKDLRDQAVRCLGLMKKPGDTSTQGGAATGMSMTGSINNKLRTSMSGGASMGASTFVRNKEALDNVIDVGKALKKVDRTLLSEWASWASGVFNFSTASILWDSFTPTACDTHSASYSQLRDTFLKLLRPGLDYKKVFTDFAERTIRRSLAKAEDEGKDMDEAKEALLSEVSLNKNQMANLLRQMGLAMKPTETRLLVDAFDSNGDGTVTLTEFLDFTGAKRDKNGGSSLAIGQKCCWQTTCKITGMPNAFSVSSVTKRAMRAEAKTSASGNVSREDSKAEDLDELPAAENLSGKVEIIVMPNGEKRMKVELKDRLRREDLLRKYGVLAAIAKPKSKQTRGAGQGGSDAKNTTDDYGDDFDAAEEEYGEDFDETDHKTTASGTNANACEHSKWTNQDRKKALSYLMELTKEARQETLLRKMLQDGKPPQAPEIWSEEVNEYTKNNNNDDPNALSLQLKWSSPKGDLVSFYSVEFGGPARGGDVRYTEIFRDPVDASPDSKIEFGCVYSAGLQPGGKYLFRIRAFNGFGPGDFTYRIFTTRTLAPPQPKVTRITSTSASLRWTFTEGFFRRMEELKQLFVDADSDGSGQVDRQELATLLEERVENSKELRLFLRKAAADNGVNLSQGYGVLFDMIEGDDNGGLCWEEFEAFFMSAGWANQASVANSTSMTIKAAQSSSAADKMAGITYVVEKCVSEFDNTYLVAMKTTSGYCTIKHLDPGQSYRFRVYSVNAIGVCGPTSDTVIVHTNLETPPAPTAVTNGISTKQINLTWPGRASSRSSRHPAVVQKMLGDWAGSHGEDDGGVSIEAAFAKYDRDGSGSIDTSEFATMLNDLGVEVNEEKLCDAFALLDTNGDGSISFEEFGVWWRRDDVVYTIKRSVEVLPDSNQVMQQRPQSSGAATSQDVSRSAAGRSVVSRPKSRGGSGAGAGGEGLSLSAIPEENSIDLLDNTGGRGERSQSARRQRPASASASATRLSGTGASQSVASSVQGSVTGQGGGNVTAAVTGVAAVAVPIVSYRDSSCKCEIKGLMPNRLYHFRLRYTGSRSYSQVSPPLVIMTAPEAPSRPILVDVGSSSVRIKWYSPAFGAFKFVVQLRQPNLSSTDVRKSMSNLGAAGVAVTGAGAADSWVTVFTGQDTMWTSTTMVSDCDYQIRIFGVNAQGEMSAPSPVMCFTTMHRDDSNKDLLGPRNADSFFGIECTGDICVGDTIMITERLFAKSSTSAAAAVNNNNNNNNSNGNANTNSNSRLNPKGSSTASMKGKSISSNTNNMKAHINSSSAMLRASAAGGVSMDMSVTSICTEGGTAIPPGTFLGERTVAAYVVKDNYRTIRDSLALSEGQPFDRKKIGKVRQLWLEVVWQRSSSDLSKQYYTLKPGSVVERQQGLLEQFEVFRCPWRQEKGRNSLQEEWRGLTDCFVQPPL